MGTPIGRKRIVKLFSRILRKEDDNTYVLVTPVEKVLINVEDAPFIATYVEILGEGKELNLKFLDEILKVVNTNKCIILWKPKRIVGSDFVSNSFKRKQDSLTKNYFKKIKPDISANSLVKYSDAVISMPFSSPSVCAKIKGIPSIFYDASEQIKKSKIEYFHLNP